MRLSTLALSVGSLAAAIFACTTDPDFVPDLDAEDDSGTDAGVSPDVSGSETDSGKDATPSGTLFGFVGSTDGKIRSYTVDGASGVWTLKGESPAGSNPSFLAFDPTKRRVVAVDEGGGSLVRSFSFDPGTGAVTEINNKPSGGGGPTHVSLDPSGKWVFVANYGGGNMSVFPLDASGMIGNASETKASGEKSHWAGTNPSGTHVFVPALGANTVAQYVLDGATGKLTDNGTASPPGGAGPRHLAFHPSEKYAYVINEVAITATSFSFDKGSGKLSPIATISALPDGQSTAGVSGAEIFAHPNGKFVYASTRVFNSIAVFGVDASDGHLTRLANVTTGGNRPRSFGITPEGTFLFAGNQDVDQVVGFKIDSATGMLTPMGKTVDVKGPSFVGLVRIP